MHCIIESYCILSQLAHFSWIITSAIVLVYTSRKHRINFTFIKVQIVSSDIKPVGTYCWRTSEITPINISRRKIAGSGLRRLVERTATSIAQNSHWLSTMPATIFPDSFKPRCSLAQELDRKAIVGRKGEFR